MTGTIQRRAVIFDMDGVLIDSEPLWRIAERQIFGRLGLDLSDAMCEQTMGFRIDEVVAHWHRRHPWSGSSPAQVEEEIVARVVALVETDGMALPGVERALRLISDHGMLLGLATSSYPVLINAVLDRLGIRRSFNAVCSGREVAHGKPRPDIFLATAQKLGLPPASCVVIEDSLAGVAAAVSAGMRVIAIPAANQCHEPGFTEADLQLESLEELTIGMVVGSR